MSTVTKSAPKVGRAAVPAVLSAVALAKEEASRVGSVPNAPWPVVSIGEVTEPRVEQTGPRAREFTYVDIGSIDRETKRIVDPKQLASSKAPSRARQLLKAGDVLVSMTRPNLNAVAIVTPEFDGAIGSTGFQVLRATGALPGYLYYAVQSPDFIDAMCRKVQGALYPAVRPRDIASYRIPLPDKSVQRRIVAEIEKQFTQLDAGVAALRRVQANLKRYRAAVLKAACEGMLVPTEAKLQGTGDRGQETASKFETGEQLLDRILVERRKIWQGRGAYKEPTAPDLAKLGQLPQGWTWATLSALIREPLRNGHSAKATGTGNGLRVFTLSAVTEGDWTEEQFSVLLNGNAGRFVWREVKHPLPKLKREWIRDDGATALWIAHSYFTITTPVREKAIEAIKKRAKTEASKLPNF